MDKQLLLKGIVQPEEKLAYSKALDRLYLCSENYQTAFTDFLDPFRTAGVLSLVKRAGVRDVSFMTYGGAEGCERQLVGFTPSYQELSNDDFPIDTVRVSYNSKYSRALAHRDFLGSVLGLGIDRGKIGDINIGDESAFVFIHSDISEYVCAILDKVGNTKVKAELADMSASIPSPAGTRVQLTVSSLRLDAVVSAVFHLSRGKSAELVGSDRVYVNWLQTADTSKQLAPNDMVTVRGLGRVQLLEVAGKTKKDRLSVYVMKY